VSRGEGIPAPARSPRRRPEAASSTVARRPDERRGTGERIGERALPSSQSESGVTAPALRSRLAAAPRAACSRRQAGAGVSPRRIPARSRSRVAICSSRVRARGRVSGALPGLAERGDRLRVRFGRSVSHAAVVERHEGFDDAGTRPRELVGGDPRAPAPIRHPCVPSPRAAHAGSSRLAGPSGGRRPEAGTASPAEGRRTRETSSPERAPSRTSPIVGRTAREERSPAPRGATFPTRGKFSFPASDAERPDRRKPRRSNGLPSVDAGRSASRAEPDRLN
jgi:hypothetical protein